MVELNTRNKEDIKARKRLKIQCERLKRILSHEYEAKITFESLYNDKDLQLRISRAKFEELCKEKFQEMIKPIEKVLKISELQKKDIDEILLVGCSTRIPKIEKDLLEFFGNNVQICKSINPDEVVAYGASLQAAISMNVEIMDDVLINDICSHSLGLAVIKGSKFDVFDKMIKNGTNIPYEIEKEYSTHYDYQENALIRIYEGENEFCYNNRLQGKFTLNNITKAKKKCS